MVKFVDIGANLLDDRFTKGSYFGKIKHEPDLTHVLERAAQYGVDRLILTAGTLRDSRDALEQVRTLRKQQLPLQVYCTVGVHPTRCQQEFVDSAQEPQAILDELLEIAQDGMKDRSVVAIGEIGLDYDRLEFCPKDIQQQYFREQLKLAKATGLPLFLHNRSVGSDLYDILKETDGHLNGGVVHSFDDSLELAQKFMDDLGLFIGINGCSLKLEENLKVVQSLPLNRLLLETDCPYCDVRKTHAGFEHVKTEIPSKKKYQAGFTLKGRNEPCHIVHVAEVVAGVKGIPIEELAEACYENSRKLYGWKRDQDTK